MLRYNSSELLLVGMIGDQIGLDAARIDLLTSNGAVKSDLQYSHWSGLQQWLYCREMYLSGPISCRR